MNYWRKDKIDFKKEMKLDHEGSGIDTEEREKWGQKEPIKYKSKVSSQRRESQNPAGNTAQIRKQR